MVKQWSNQANIDLLRARDMFDYTYKALAKCFHTTEAAVKQQLYRLHKRGLKTRPYRRYEFRNFI